MRYELFRLKGRETEEWMTDLVCVDGQENTRRVSALNEFRTIVSDREKLQTFVRSLLLCANARALMDQVVFLVKSYPTLLNYDRVSKSDFLDHILSFADGVKEGVSYNNLRYHLRNALVPPVPRKK